MAAYFKWAVNKKKEINTNHKNAFPSRISVDFFDTTFFLPCHWVILIQQKCMISSMPRTMISFLPSRVIQTPTYLSLVPTVPPPPPRRVKTSS
eukprot:5774686-Ditylum_brightwellii.AAC.1